MPSANMTCKEHGFCQHTSMWVCDQCAPKISGTQSTDAQQPQPAMCLGCEYWRMPSGGHCMRGEGVEFCFKVGTHAGVR